MARPDIKTVEQLRGKRVGIDSMGGSIDYSMRHVLKRYGLDPERDVVPLVLGAGRTRLASLFAGTTDASIFSLPEVEFARERGYSELHYMGQTRPVPFSGMATSVKKIQENPAQVKKVLRAQLKGLRFVKQNREEVIPFMRQEWQLGEAFASSAYGSLVRGISKDGGARPEGIKLVLEELRDRLKIKEEIPAARVIDFTLLREVQRELGF